MVTMVAVEEIRCVTHLKHVGSNPHSSHFFGDGFGILI